MCLALTSNGKEDSQESEPAPPSPPGGDEHAYGYADAGNLAGDGVEASKDEQSSNEARTEVACRQGPAAHTSLHPRQSTLVGIDLDGQDPRSSAAACCGVAELVGGDDKEFPWVEQMADSPEIPGDGDADDVGSEDVERHLLLVRRRQAVPDARRSSDECDRHCCGRRRVRRASLEQRSLGACEQGCVGRCHVSRYCQLLLHRVLRKNGAGMVKTDWRASAKQPRPSEAMRMLRVRNGDPCTQLNREARATLSPANNPRSPFLLLLTPTPTSLACGHSYTDTNVQTPAAEMDHSHAIHHATKVVVPLSSPIVRGLVAGGTGAVGLAAGLALGFNVVTFSGYSKVSSLTTKQRLALWSANYYSGVRSTSFSPILLPSSPGVRSELVFGQAEHGGPEFRASTA